MSPETGRATVKSSFKPDQRSNNESARHPPDDYQVVVTQLLPFPLEVPNLTPISSAGY
jgi:hypothetical protein